jgi:hypothetical protein
LSVAATAADGAASSMARPAARKASLRVGNMWGEETRRREVGRKAHRRAAANA